VLLKQEKETVAAAGAELDTTVEDVTWANLTTADDFEKREVVNLTTSAGEEAVTSCDTNVVDQGQSSLTTNVDADFLNEIVNEINNLHASVSEDSSRVVGTSETMRPPCTPNAEESAGEEGVAEASVLEESGQEELSTTVDTETAAEAESGVENVDVVVVDETQAVDEG